MAKKQIKKYVFEPGIGKDSSLYPNAAALLSANKAFLQAQVVAFINNQIAGNIAPYNGYTYASQKCTRDVGLILDAIIHDVKYGGNVKTRQVADYFWIDGEPMIRGDVSPETTAQAYLRDIINIYIFTNTTVTPSYGQTAVPQVKITGQNAESGASALNTSLWNAISNVITNGIIVMPEKITGVSSIRCIGNYTISEILLITNTDTGEILYNFSDPANSIRIELKKGRSSGDGNLLSDVDFPTWWRTEDAITTIDLSVDTSTLSSTASLQIYVDEPYQTIKPWEFGTDAIERMRVAMPQAMLDADFEYGLQPTKWQGYGQVRGYPSLYELPGTDLSIISIITDASVSTGGFGSSLITVRTNGTHGLVVGQPITVVGLDSNVSGFARAEGTFLVFQITSAVTFTYYSSAKVGTVNGQSLTTSFVQIRQAQYYTGANIGQPTYSVVNNGSNDTILSKFSTPAGEFQFVFEGNPPTPGQPVSGSASIAPGTTVAGVIGAGVVSAEILDTTSPSDTSISLTNAAGILGGMAIDDGSGNAIFITSIVGTTLNLSSAISQVIEGSTGVSTGVSGSLIESIGVGGTFDVSRAGGIYTVSDSLDSTALGQNYSIGDLINIAGTSLGGASPANDLTIVVTGIDSGGSITSFNWTGTAASGSQTYTGVSGTVVNPLPGSGAVFSISRSAGNYTVAVPTSGGTDYQVGQRIIISGIDLGGSSPANDCELTVTSVSGLGEILTVTALGTSTPGSLINIYPVLNISEALINVLPDATIINVGAIATIQITFSSPHGLIPGTPMFNQIVSNPPPTFESQTGTMPASSTWSGVAFGNSVFVAVQNGSDNTAVSTDGVNWLAGGTLPSSGNWTSVAAGEISGIWYFVAVRTGSDQYAYSTDDGASWTAGTLPSSGTWNSITFFLDRFIAVRAASTAAAFSTDGVNWTAATLPSSSTWTDVVGGLVGTSEYIVAIASGGTAAAYSVDLGVNWVAATLPASVTWSSITFGNSRFFAVARGSATGAISTNGVTWVSTTLPSAANWNNVTFGIDNFFVVADGSTSALISFDAVTGSFAERTLPASATWEETAFGFYPLTGGIFVTVGNTTNVLNTKLTSANHQLAAGPFTITSVPTPTVIRYPARAPGNIDIANPIIGTAYTRPDSFFVHRPFDGGVQLGTGGPAHGVQTVRQSKKYIRYQSGKGMFYNTGALFAPSYSIRSATALGTTVNSVVIFTLDDNDHGLQPGAVIEIVGMTSFEYNGEYTVEGIIDSRSFTVRNPVVLTTTSGELTSEAKVILKRWHGSTVRIGTFDEQNGIFYQYDGQRLAVGKRSSTNQLTGTISLDIESNEVTGSNTRFSEQLAVGDKIVIRGMSHVVTSITDNTSMTVNPDWRGASNVVGSRFAKTEDEIWTQDEWNIDPLDGTGPSGYDILPWRMQMIATQYTWYAVGFIEWMLRGGDGRFVFLHRVRNSNVNTEAYMRTANLPVRYEVENVGAKSKLRKNINSTVNQLEVFDGKFFPSNGTVYIDNELITYAGKNGNILTGLTRSSSMTNFSAGQNRTFTAGPAASHSAGTGVVLVSNTASPTISHWGSALITDGSFDQDRGYLFSYTTTGTNTSTTRQTAFMIRLAPSVSNGLVGDLGERDLLNRAQLLLQSVAITIDTSTSQGAILIEGVLNPRNYPANPANIIWNGISNQGAGGQPSFAQIALGGSINWGGVPITTTTAVVNGAVTLNTTARAFNTINQTLTAIGNSGLAGYARAIESGRNDFLITNTQYDSFESSTPILVGDSLVSQQFSPFTTFISSGTTIQSITRGYLGSNFTRIVMNRNAVGSTSPGNNQNVTCTNQFSVIFNNAYSSTRNTIALRTVDIDNGRIIVGDTLQSGFLAGNRSIVSFTRDAFKISGNLLTIVTMNQNASSTSSTGSDQSLTIQIPQTAASYAGTNFLFFTNSSWNSSGAGINTRVSPGFTSFPGGTSVAAVSTRVLGFTTVVRVTFSQTLVSTVNAGGTVTFEFGDPQFALPGEQVFAFVANPGNTVELDLSELKELTTTAIGGRGTFPNGPDVLAINVIKITGTPVPASIILRWSEAQA
jgi:hypothetical protein